MHRKLLPLQNTAKLARKGIIDSRTGVGGGFEIPAYRLEIIKLTDVVRLIDGDEIFDGCSLGLPECSEEKPCPLHHKFKLIKADYTEMLDNSSFKELAEVLSSGDSFLKF